MSSAAHSQAPLDYVAIGMSLLCAIHCSLLPLMVAAMPWIAALGIVDEWFHRAILVAVIPVSGWALGRAWVRNGQSRPLILGIIGMTLMLLAVMEFLAWHSRGLEIALTLSGAALLSLGHLINLRNFLRPASVASSLGVPGPGY